MPSPLEPLRNARLWVPGLIRSRMRLRRRPRTAWVAICDHFEPLWHGADAATADERVRTWRQAWPEIAARHHDSAGRPPQYTFFYPEEEYRPSLLEPLAELTRGGIADVEVHLHHDADTRDGFTREDRALHSHALQRTTGCCACATVGSPSASSTATGPSTTPGRTGAGAASTTRSRCSRDFGCYADFTMPAAPDPSQAGPVNAIFDVTDDPDRPRSHERGVLVKRGSPARDLTLITGPLGVTFGAPGRWKPQLENGDLAHYRPPAPHRVGAWLSLAPRIDDHAFIKLFAHGAQEKNAACLLGGGLDLMFRSSPRAAPPARSSCGT